MSMYLEVQAGRDFAAYKARLLNSGAMMYERKDGDFGELKKLTEGVVTKFEALKSAVEERDTQLKKLGTADGLLEEKIAKINADITREETERKALKEQLDKIDVALQRVAKGGNAGDKDQAAELRRKAWNEYGRKSQNETFNDFIRGREEYKTLSVGSDPDGGYTVLADTSGVTAAKIYETSPIRTIASVTTITTDALEGKLDNDQASSGWVAETGSRPQTNTPQLGRWRIPVHEQYANPAATQQLLDDSTMNVEAWLAGKVADIMGRTENTAFVSGNGVGKPKGFTSYALATTTDATRGWGTLEYVPTLTAAGYGTGANGANKLITLVHQLKTGYRAGASWVMSRATLGVTRTLKDDNGSFVWLPAMTAGQNSSLLNFPVTEAEDMAAIGTDSYSVYFGNFRTGYQIVDRQGIRTLRDPYSSKPLVQFYTTKRVGGDVINFECLKALRFGTA